MSSFAHTLAKRYQEKKPNSKEIIMISLPDDSILVKAIVEGLNGGMMDQDPVSKKPSLIYQEISLLLKLGTECMIVYRDKEDSILIIYFKRLKNESLDSNGHQFSIVQTHFKDLDVLNDADYPIKLRLLLKDISIYINRKDLLKKLSYKGQNRHYFIFNPDYLGSAGKKSLCFNHSERAYELNYEDLSMDKIWTYGTTDSVVTISMPPLSFLSFFDFDFMRTNVCINSKISFRESYEQVLHNQKGEAFLLDHIDIAKFEDYLTVQKKYCKIVEDLIDSMKTSKTIISMEGHNNYLIFDINILQRELATMRSAPYTDIEPWFSFKVLENKAILYSAINNQYKITNVLNLPPNLCQKLGYSQTSGSVLGLFAYNSQEEYSKMITRLLVEDRSELNKVK